MSKKSGNTFTFKKFAVEQSRAAMKVGTDGVLLGAWVRLEPSDRRLLDIGTGTGLIALMLAQRIDELRRPMQASATAMPLIDAVEIDRDSALQARENVERSPWAPMIRIHNSSIQDFYEMVANGAAETAASIASPLSGTENRSTAHCEKYDRIVSNPPWFVDSLLSPHAARSAARHTCALTYDELAVCVAALLATQGAFSAVVPADSEKMFRAACLDHDLALVRRTEVFTTPGTAPKRLLLELQHLRHTTAQPRCDSLTIGTGRHEDFTEEYRRLTSPFYLKF